MSELPDLKAGMPIGQACYLELMHILVEQEVITLEEATTRYKKRRLEFSGVGPSNWSHHD